MLPIRWVLGLTFILVAVLLAGCEPAERDPIESNAAGPRIVSLSPGMTETLFALGAGDRVIGRSDYCDHPPAVLELPTAGTSLSPAFEAIAKLKPSVILIEASQTGFRRELEQLAVVVELPWLGLPEVVDGIRVLGDRFGRQAEAQRLADAFAARLGPPPQADAVNVLLTLGHGVDGTPLWYIRRNSLHGAALHAAGGRNAIDRDVTGNATLSIEGLLDLDPDMIIALVPEQGSLDDARQAAIEAFGQLPGLRAVRSGRIGVVAGNGYLRTGPRVLEFADVLTAELARLQRVQTTGDLAL